VWAEPEWNCVQALDVGTPLSYCVSHPEDPDTVLVAESGNCVRSLSVSEGAFKESIEFKDRIKAMAFTPDGKMALFGDIKGKLFVYRYPTAEGEQMKKMAQEVIADRPVTHIATESCQGAASEAMVVVNSLSGKIKMGSLKWDLGFAKAAKLEIEKVFTTANRSATIRASFCPPLAIWPKSHTIVCGAEDNSLHLFNKDKKGEPWCNMLNGHEAPVLAADWSTDGTILVSGDQGGSVAIWCRDPANE